MSPFPTLRPWPQLGAAGWPVRMALWLGAARLTGLMLAGLLALSASGPAAAQAQPGNQGAGAGQVVRPELVAREADLAQQLRCVVCQNQTVAESRAPLAQDMRRVIREQLAQGRSDAEVVAFFEQRYGPFVRYQPPWRPSTWLLWCGPFVLALAGLLLLRRSLRRREPSARLADADRRRAQAWLDQNVGPSGRKESP